MLLAAGLVVILFLMIIATLTQRSHAREQSRRHHPTNGL